MRKLIIATAAVALLSASGAVSGAFAQDKTAAPAATSGDTMSKGDGMKMSKTKKSKKSKKSSGDDAAK